MALVSNDFAGEPMTILHQLIKSKVAILTMAAELQNVVKACRLAGISRSQFYTMKKAYETHGTEGLAPRVRRKPRMPNRTPVLLEDQILLKTRINPTVSYLRLAGDMKLEGIGVTPAMVRYVWERHGLSIRSARLQWVKRNGHLGGVKETTGRNALQKVLPKARVSARTAPSSMSINITVQRPR